MADSAIVNVVLVPALILLLGLVFYKKVWEPRHGASKPEKATKVNAKRVKSPKVKPEKMKPEKIKPQKVKAQNGDKGRTPTSSGRMGSVL